MINQQLLQQISEKIAALKINSEQLPSAELLKQQIGQILQGSFNRLDLVSRAEFDAQTAVLEETRTQLETLKKELQHKR